jgi:NTE family protein/lysophospholipid hydrolase
MAEQNFLSREALLGGRLSTERKALRTLGTIGARVSHMRSESRQAVRALFSGREDEFRRTFGDDYLRSLKLGAQYAEAPVWSDLERLAATWRQLVPAEADIRAALISALIARYGVTPEAAPHALEAAGYGNADVGAAYQQLFGTPLDRAAFPATAPEHQDRPAPAAGDGEAAALREAEEAIEWLSVPAGTVLIHEGDEPDFLYFVISGRLRITTGSGAEQRVIADLGRGELVGEIGVLTGERRTASATAMRDSEVVRLPQAEVLRMAYQSPQMLLRVNHILAQRLRVELTAKPHNQALQLTLAIVAFDASTPLRDLTAELVTALQRLGPVAHVSRERAEREFPRLAAGFDPSEDGELLAWLSEQETRNQFVVFEADTAAGRWTDLCIRQADRVAIVARAGADPGPAAVEERIALMNPAARKELVLVHEPGSQPEGTRSWLQRRVVSAHHHVVVEDATLVGRLARRLAGQAVGLVLGGGGVRGYAHIGAWRALEEAGIPVDIVGGTSVGAIMAAGMAGNRNAAEMEELGRIFARQGITDLTLPVVSFFSSRSISSLLHKHTRGERIEDLWRPFFSVSTSLRRAEPVVHRAGPLWKAARASSAIPGLFPPVAAADGDLLVDGGIMNNVPVDIMRTECERGPVIAIDLSVATERTSQYRFGPVLSGWQVLWSRVNPLAPKVEAPSIFTTLLRTTEAGSVHRMRTGEVMRMADLVVHPPMEQVGLLDIRNHESLVRIGYEATRDAVARWLADNPEVDRKLRGEAGS